MRGRSRGGGPTGRFESLWRIEIRELRQEDHDGWMELWEGYLRFYRVEIGEPVTSMTFARLREAKDGMFGLVAVDEDGEVLGFANSLVHPSTWSIAGYCYLEDLFVAPHARGGEVAKGLIDAVTAVARERGVERVYWHTQQFNGAARSLYDTVGRLTSMVVYEREA
jgi:GNAT superfamily N-acetyltransferase